MATNKQLQIKQAELDAFKWLDSELGEDKCGTYDYCVMCDATKEFPCARAFYVYKNQKLEFRANVKLSDLALQIQDLRMIKKLTIGHAAKLIGIEPLLLFAYENDKAKPTALELQRILAVLENGN